ncbi:MAG: imelysin family protein [Cyclobacteriaceae bacterium]
MNPIINKTRIFFVLIAILSGCNGDDPARDTGSKDRTPMLIHWVDNIIVPGYNNFQTKMEVMVLKGDEFTESPNQQSLTAFRQAWVDAYVEWQKVEMFEFGPADKYTLRNFFNIYPANVQAIHQNIVDPNADLDVAAAYSTQGFPALDYLINGVAETDEGIIAFYSTASESGSRIQYLKQLTSRMETLLNNVVLEWSNYRESFIGKTGLDLNSSTGIVVNAYVLYYERYIRSGKFGIPSGALTTTGGTQYPDKVEAFYKKDISLTLARTAHQAAIDFFNGEGVTTTEEGPSLKSYLDALEAKDGTTGTLLSQIINDQFAAVNNKLSQLSENLHEQVSTNNNGVKDVFAEMQKATRILKVDMTSAMSITITYTDNDGD